MKPRDMLYHIDPEACTACGECEKVCVGKAITPGDIYEINEMYCLECGSCYNVCSTGAVTQKE